MAKAGDSYVIELKASHINWGEFRYTNSRGTIKDEGYIPIPKEYAVAFGVYNSNYSLQGMGYNEFNCKTEDGFYSGVVKATGCTSKGDVYAKQFNGKGNLKAFGLWFKKIGAKKGDTIEVRFTSPTDMVIRKVEKGYNAAVEAEIAAAEDQNLKA